jgi:tetratricopeptide (TPR) repeat protein
MKPRPTIFLSGVSSEFASFREAVEVEIQKKGCFVENQSSFATDYRTVEAMLRQKLSEADAVIHIVGFRYGAEPKQRPAEAPRRSYTQMEFDIAREFDKPVYVCLSENAGVRDAANPDETPEDAELSTLQAAHRDAVRASDHLYYGFKDKEELCRLAAAISTVAAVDFRADLSRIDKYAPAELIGRENELALLDDAWLKVRRAETPRTHVITFVALGGEGKTSLVAKWVAELANDGWPGCDAAFAWSFYSQGTREQFAASSDLFLKEAITFFGDENDEEFAGSSAGPYDKGQRLARIVGQRHNLLILDGLEPLQYAPSSPTAGELKDHGITALLKGLAATSKGLCIVTTRYSLPNLNVFRQTTTREVKLLRLSREAGVDLLKTLDVKGTSTEFEALVENVKGHALTLNLMGTYLRDAHGGDIRRRDLVKLEEADAEEQSGHAFRVMEAYEQVFEAEDERGKRALAILRLLGLFDRPLATDCLEALLEEPGIPNLTGPLVGLNEEHRNLVLRRLEDARLITVNREASGILSSIDAHPLLREYFGQKLSRQQPASWCAAQKRLYEHLCNTTPDKNKPTLEDLQPLYQALAHGCHAGLHRQALHQVYIDRITRRDEFYSTKILGAFASDLGAIACFFEIPWTRVSQAFPANDEAWLLGMAAYRLRGVGRLIEALKPSRAAMKIFVRQESWNGAAINANTLVQLELTLGKVAEAVGDAEQSVSYADRSSEVFQRITSRCGHANALNQAGHRTEASRRFAEAEQMQSKAQPQFPMLYSLQGFLYCDLVLDNAERSAWQAMLERGDLPRLSAHPPGAHQLRALLQHEQHMGSLPALEDLLAAYERAQQALKWYELAQQQWPRDTALDHLTIGRVALYIALISQTSSRLKVDDSTPDDAFYSVVDVLRQAGDTTYLPVGFLNRALLRFLVGARTGSESAQEDLDEAWDIAERGPMRLHMADIHLYRARLFFREKEYPWESARADLEEAERLINECGYHRRDEELADAKRAILGT